MIIRSRAPLRISFSGGGTDVEPYLSEYGGQVLNTTIDMFSHATLESRKDNRILLKSEDIGPETEEWDLFRPAEEPLKLLKACVKCCNLAGFMPHGGFNLTTHSDAPPGSGLGSSSALAVAVIGTMMEARRRAYSLIDVARAAITAERVIAGIKGGKQDQYAAAVGGFNRTVFHKGTNDINILPLAMNTGTLLELEANLLLCYTGCSRADLGVIDDQTARLTSENSKEKSLHALHTMKAECRTLEDILMDKSLIEFGTHLDELWTLKKNLTPLISNLKIDAMYATAREHGCIGGKLLGAGGGGHLLLFVPPENRKEVKYHLTELGGVIVPFHFNPKGLEVWTV